MYLGNHARLSIFLHGALGSYQHYALQEGSADAAACSIIAARAQARLFSPVLGWWSYTDFLSN
jgi:hypothetical protein